jgi:hypothetical protein
MTEAAGNPFEEFDPQVYETLGKEEQAMVAEFDETMKDVERIRNQANKLLVAAIQAGQERGEPWADFDDVQKWLKNEKPQEQGELGNEMIRSQITFGKGDGLGANLSGSPLFENSGKKERENGGDDDLNNYFAPDELDNIKDSQSQETAAFREDGKETFS